MALPIFEEPEIVAKSIDGDKEILEKYPLIVVDRKGGEPLREYASFYQKNFLFRHWIACMHAKELPPN